MDRIFTVMAVHACRAVAAALVVVACAPAAASAAVGQPFTTLQSPYTQALYGTSNVFFGGVAFSPQGDVWVDECSFSGSPLHRFSATQQHFTHGTTVHDESTVASSAGCGLTNGPGGRLYSNTSGGVARIDASTGAPIDIVGAPGNALGITVDPRNQHVVYVGADCRFSGTCTIFSLDTATGTSVPFAQLSGSQAAFVDGITFDPSGDHLLLSIRSPGFALGVVNRAGTLVRSTPISSEPDGLSFHSTDPEFAVTNNNDGTMTRFDFPGGDLSQTPTQTQFASGGFRGDLSLVGADGCIYLTQSGAHYLDGTTTGENSIVQICPGFAPSPGVTHDHLVYVALGDSYSSGEGAPPFEDGTNYPIAPGGQENTYTFGGGNGCHRSLTNYAKIAAPLLSPNLETILYDRTCSGAEIVPDPASAKGPIVDTPYTSGRTDGQVDQVRSRLAATGRSPADVQLVSATMGGNDAGFGDLIEACLIPNLAQTLFRLYDNVPGEIEWVLDHFGNCKRFDGLFFHTGDKIDGLRDKVFAGQINAQADFPNARLLQLTYPGIVPAGDDFPGDTCGGLLRGDASYVRGKVGDIDGAVRDAAALGDSIGFTTEIVDIQNRFGTNALCPADPSKALANGIDQARLESVITELLQPGSPTRALVDNLSDRWQGFRNCVISHSFFGIVGELFCKGPLDNLKDALKQLQDYFTPDRIQALVGGLAAGDTPEQRFDNSRLFFHPNAIGFGVMACNLTAVYKHSSQDACAPSLGGVLTYIMNGVRLSHVDPIVLVPGAPVPFRFNGFDPGTNLNATVHSAVRSLGSFAVDASGEASGSLTLPVDLEPGVHRVTFRGTNHGSPRSIDVLVKIDGRPIGGGDYGLYETDFDHDGSVAVTYGGLDWGSFTPNEEGGVFVEVPLPAPGAPGEVSVTLTGADSGRVVKRTILPAPAAAGVWARGHGSTAVDINANGAKIAAWVHSDGGVRVRGQGNNLSGGVEYATDYVQSGNGQKVSPAPVKVAPGGSPLTVDIPAWRPGGALAAALGSGYRAIPASACRQGAWTAAANDLRGAKVTYVPCALNLVTTGGSATTAFVAEGPIALSATGMRLSATGQGFELASGGAINVTGVGIQMAAPIWAAGAVGVSGDGAQLVCGIYGDSISLTGQGMKIPACG